MKLNIKFHSTLVYAEKYKKVKVKEFNSVVDIKLLDDEVPKEGARITLA